MNAETAILVTVSVVCFLWALYILVRRRPRYLYDPEPALHQRQCPTCERPIFLAKDVDGHTLILDASAPIYVQLANSETGSTRVARTAGYITHEALCRPAYLLPLLRDRLTRSNTNASHL